MRAGFEGEERDGVTRRGREEEDIGKRKGGWREEDKEKSETERGRKGKQDFPKRDIYQTSRQILCTEEAKVFYKDRISKKI